MNETKLLLVRALSLLFRESQLNNEERSFDLVQTVLEAVKIPDLTLGVSSEREVLHGLKNAIIEMCQQGKNYDYDPKTLLQQINVVCGHDDHLYNILEEEILDKRDEASLKRQITDLREKIDGYFRKNKIEEVLNKAHYALKFKPESILNVGDFVQNIRIQLEPFELGGMAQKDAAIISEINFSDEKSVREAFQKSEDAYNGDMVQKIGWQDQNEALDGGFRRGECVFINAQKHNYKSGTALTYAVQIALFNKPFMLDSGRKPLIARFSFEDDNEKDIRFIYEYLLHSETGQKVNTKNTPIDKMQGYVRERLSCNGFDFRVFRIDPTRWTYRDAFNFILKLEAQGYELHALNTDYLGKLIKTGSNSGWLDLRDMVLRWRNFCGAKKITLINPHQLDTNSNNVRNQYGDAEFVRYIHDRNMYSGSKELGHEIDVDIYVHKFSDKTSLGYEHYLTWQVGKHRGFVVDSEKAYGLLRFPKGGMPIPHDVDRDNMGLRKVPRRGGVNTDPSDFEL